MSRKLLSVRIPTELRKLVDEDRGNLTLSNYVRQSIFDLKELKPDFLFEAKKFRTKYKRPKIAIQVRSVDIAAVSGATQGLTITEVVILALLSKLPRSVWNDDGSRHSFSYCFPRGSL